MGTFFDSIHIRTTKIAEFNDIVTAIAKGRFSYILTTPYQGWISLLLDENGLNLDEESNDICLDLSRRCESLILKTKEYDSDIFFYTCFVDGKIIDSFISHPDYFEPISQEERNKSRGQPESWVNLLDFSVDVNELRQILDLMQSDVLCNTDGTWRFAGLLFLDNVCTNYYMLKETELDPEWITYDCTVTAIY
ncbi:MAG: hypothetical protein LBP59_14395 [Planctomycetaceae bacterium]|jgi:hypothetical protein|nr:hypothetical protein [Planctomycetaceae bacterium]